MNTRITIILAVTVVLLVVAEALWAPHHHPVFPYHHIPGFLATIGLAASIVVTLLAKTLGKKLLQRKEKPHD